MEARNSNRAVTPTSSCASIMNESVLVLPAYRAILGRRVTVGEEIRQWQTEAVTATRSRVPLLTH